MYADKISEAMENAIRETERRRNIQIQYNKKHNITPFGMKDNITEVKEVE